MNAYDFGINNVINIIICTKFILSNTVRIVFRCAKFTNLDFKKIKMNTIFKIPFIKLKNSSNIEKHFLGNSLPCYNKLS